MANIVILGAGVMGSALAVTASTHSANHVTLVGSPLDDEIIGAICQHRHHPVLQAGIPPAVVCINETELDHSTMHAADIVVIGVSSPGITWVVNKIKRFNVAPACIALVTKGLVAAEDPQLPPLTYADALANDLDPRCLVGIGGPCIARELALGFPTFVTFGSHDVAVAKKAREYFQTDYYRVAIHSDFVGLEACAALKNFFCIGVSAMLGAWELEGQHAKNPVAALFNQAVLEMALLSDWMRHGSESSSNRTIDDETTVAFDLPGMGDLHVTVGGGRNSKLGTLLGQGHTLSEIVKGPMKGVTVEGLDTGRQLLAGFNRALATDTLPAAKLPLTIAILRSINEDALFTFKFSEYCADTW